MQQSHVEITTPVRIEERGEHYRRTTTEERTYRFDIEGFKDYDVAFRRAPLSIFEYFLDAGKYSANDRPGWALDLPDGATVYEADDQQVSASANTSAILLAVGEDLDPGEGDAGRRAYQKLRRLAVGEHAPPEAPQAFEKFLKYHTTLGPEAVSEWEPPEHFAEYL